jgi:hypothetical protein
LKKIYFSPHKLSKQQLTSFWSQGILGVKVERKVCFPCAQQSLTPKGRSPFFGPFLKFGYAIVDAIFV